MELSERRRFPKPTFQDVEKAFLVAKSSLHVCQIANPMDGNRGTDEAAPRVCEALLVASRVVERRNDIIRSEKKILGAYSYEVYGRLCPHGVALDSAHLGDCLTAEWGEPFQVKERSSRRLTGKPGIICFKSIPGQTGTKSRIDLWNGKRCLGESEHWDAGDIRFWELPAAAGASDS